VLVPARDEERDVGPCLRSLLAQEYPAFEVWVLDDGSSDGTARVLEGLAQGDGRLGVMQGAPTPSGWLGKHWACHQLAGAADGELLLFTDADTRHHPLALREAVAALQAEGADLLSALPRQEAGSWAERLLVPILSWSILSFLPLALARRVRLPALSAAVGQFLLFRREAYEGIGGHAAVRDDAVDDLALARRAVAAGLTVRLADGHERVRCRMYEGAREVWEGLSKNLYAAFGYRALALLFVWLWLAVVFLQPVVVLACYVVGSGITGRSVVLALAAVGEALLLWGLHHRRFGYRLWWAALYPWTMAWMVGVALSSLALTVTGRATWKGRRMGRPVR
jgi:chlorobactene glucosyltransferase